MPRDVLFPFETPSYGSATTCSIQGFLAYVGGILVIFGNCTLSLYYLCNLRYKVKDKTMNNYLLPIMFTLAVVFAIGPGVILLNNDLINPQVYDAYCKIGAYPFYCIFSESVECQRGHAESQFMIFMIVRYLFVVIVCGFVFISFCMTMIVLSVCSSSTKNRVLVSCLLPPTLAETEKKKLRRSTNLSSSLQHDDSNCNDSNIARPDQQQEEHVCESAITVDSREAKVVAFQAFLYVLSFILTWICTTLVFVIDSDVIRYMKIIFQPLQGFSNAIIFFHHKVHNLKRSCPEIGWCEALVKSIRDPKCVPEEFVSSIDIVDMNILLSVLRDDAREESNSSSLPMNDVADDENGFHSSQSDFSNDSNQLLIDSLSVRMAPSKSYSFDGGNGDSQDDSSNESNNDPTGPSFPVLVAAKSSPNYWHTAENGFSSKKEKSSNSLRLEMSSKTRKEKSLVRNLAPTNRDFAEDSIGAAGGKELVSPRTYYT